MNDIIELLGNPQIASDVIELMLEKLKGSEQGKASSHLVSFLRAYTSMDKREITKGFNSFSVEDRRKLLSLFPTDERAKFIDKLRCQASKNFWTHERELIENGQCTRNWTPEQIECIMNISEKTGNKKLDAGVPKDIKPNH